MSYDAKHVAVAAKSVVSVYRISVKSFLPFVLAFNYMHKVCRMLPSYNNYLTSIGVIGVFNRLSHA